MSELRKDIVSGEWMLHAPERLMRPHEALARQTKRKRVPLSECPFEDLAAHHIWPPLFAYPNEKDWEIVIVPNGYPAFVHDAQCAHSIINGPYETMKGVGSHELLITRNHDKGIADMSDVSNIKMFKMLQEHYLRLQKDSCIAYISTFLNYGPLAGSSVYHHHLQIVSTPIVPPRISRSLSGSREYTKRHGRCPHCDMIRHEEKEKKRVIVKNKWAVAYAPFVSHDPFTVTIFPRAHIAFFERTPSLALGHIVKALGLVLKKIKRNLHDPDLNVFIHTAPIEKGSDAGHYHWHIEIIPRVMPLGGFELSTGLEVNVMDPDRVASMLRATS